MDSVVSVKKYPAPPFCEREALRYAGVRGIPDAEVTRLFYECLRECESRLVFKVCYRRFDVKIENDEADLGFIKLSSKALSKNLSGCDSAVIFAATIGIGIDRLISKYSLISPAKALMFQAIGAERIESLCNAFCDELKEKNAEVRPRFSPGFGDLALSFQAEIFRVLDCERKIGLTLNESMLMSPSKSVTAIVGMKG